MAEQGPLSETAVSLATPCPRLMNQGLVGFVGLGLFDVIVLVGLGFGGLALRILVDFSPVYPLLVMLGAGMVVWTCKRGKPRGALPHLLHEQDLLPLPGVLAPTQQRYHQWV